MVKHFCEAMFHLSVSLSLSVSMRVLWCLVEVPLCVVAQDRTGPQDEQNLVSGSSGCELLF